MGNHTSYYYYYSSSSSSLPSLSSASEFDWELRPDFLRFKRLVLVAEGNKGLNRAMQILQHCVREPEDFVFIHFEWSIQAYELAAHRRNFTTLCKLKRKLQGKFSVKINVMNVLSDRDLVWVCKLQARPMLATAVRIDRLTMSETLSWIAETVQLGEVGVFGHDANKRNNYASCKEAVRFKFYA